MVDRRLGVARWSRSESRCGSESDVDLRSCRLRLALEIHLTTICTWWQASPCTCQSKAEMSGSGVACGAAGTVSYKHVDSGVQRVLPVGVC